MTEKDADSLRKQLTEALQKAFPEEIQGEPHDSLRDTFLFHTKSDGASAFFRDSGLFTKSQIHKKVYYTINNENLQAALTALEKFCATRPAKAAATAAGLAAAGSARRTPPLAASKELPHREPPTYLAASSSRSVRSDPRSLLAPSGAFHRAKAEAPPFSLDHRDLATVSVGGMTFVPFYDRKQPNYIFANYWEGPTLKIDGVEYKTPEHYFQAQKFPKGSLNHEAIRLARGKDGKSDADAARKKAAELFQHPPVNQETINAWQNGGNYIAMLKVVAARYTTDAKFREALDATHPHYVYEDTYTGPRGGGTPDSIWGGGPDGQGQNLLGLALMQVRDEAKKAAAGKEAEALREVIQTARTTLEKHREDTKQLEDWESKVIPKSLREKRQDAKDKLKTLRLKKTRHGHQFREESLFATYKATARKIDSAAPAPAPAPKPAVEETTDEKINKLVLGFLSSIEKEKPEAKREAAAAAAAPAAAAAEGEEDGAKTSPKKLPHTVIGKVFDRKHGPDSDRAQAIEILEAALKEAGTPPTKKIGLTYSANQDQMKAIIEAYRKNPVAYEALAEIGGDGQAKVIAEIIKLLTDDSSDTGDLKALKGKFKSLRDTFHIIPLPTMLHAGGVGGPAEWSAVLKSLENLETHLREHGPVIGWQTSDTLTKTGAPFALGGGTAAAAGLENNPTYQAQIKLMQAILQDPTLLDTAEYKQMKAEIEALAKEAPKPAPQEPGEDEPEPDFKANIAGEFAYDNPRLNSENKIRFFNEAFTRRSEKLVEILQNTVGDKKVSIAIKKDSLVANDTTTTATFEVTFTSPAPAGTGVAPAPETHELSLTRTKDANGHGATYTLSSSTSGSLTNQQRLAILAAQIKGMWDAEPQAGKIPLVTLPDPHGKVQDREITYKGTKFTLEGVTEHQVNAILEFLKAFDGGPILFQNNAGKQLRLEVPRDLSAGIAAAADGGVPEPKKPKPTDLLGHLKTEEGVPKTYKLAHDEMRAFLERYSAVTLTMDDAGQPTDSTIDVSRGWSYDDERATFCCGATIASTTPGSAHTTQEVLEKELAATFTDPLKKFAEKIQNKELQGKVELHFALQDSERSHHTLLKIKIDTTTDPKKIEIENIDSLSGQTNLKEIEAAVKIAFPDYEVTTKFTNGTPPQQDGSTCGFHVLAQMVNNFAPDDKRETEEEQTVRALVQDSDRHTKELATAQAAYQAAIAASADDDAAAAYEPIKKAASAYIDPIRLAVIQMIADTADPTTALHTTGAGAAAAAAEAPRRMLALDDKDGAVYDTAKRPAPAPPPAPAP